MDWRSILRGGDNESLDASQGATELWVLIAFRWCARMRVDIREIRIGSGVAVDGFTVTIFRFAYPPLFA
jgi:hypothetical protein